MSVSSNLFLQSSINYDVPLGRTSFYFSCVSASSTSGGLAGCGWQLASASSLLVYGQFFFALHVYFPRIAQDARAIRIWDSHSVTCHTFLLSIVSLLFARLITGLTCPAPAENQRLDFSAIRASFIFFIRNTCFLF